MNKKSIYAAKRLDRVAPDSDRRYIAAGGYFAVVTAILSVTALALILTSSSVLHRAAEPLMWCGYGVAAAALFFLIKETIRNRFFSAVLFLFVAGLALAANIAATVLWAAL